MDGLTAFGLFAVTAMLVCYALEDRSHWFILAFAGSCALGSLYGFLQGAWPFGVVEAIWCAVAGRRWCSSSKGEAMAADQPAIACTLTAGDLRDRLAWIAALNRDVLRGYDRSDLTLQLRYCPQGVQHVRDLMRREQACCAFLTFELHEQPDEVVLMIKAPEEVRDALNSLFEPFLSRGP